MMRFTKCLCSVCIVLICLYMQCTQPVAGGTSTTDNPKVLGSILDSDRLPVSGVRVLLLPADFDPMRNTGAMTADTTDVDGKYELQTLRSGTFNVQAVHAGTGGLIRDVNVNNHDSVVLVDDLSIDECGTVRVDIHGAVGRTSGYIYIPGTTVFKLLTDVDGTVELDGVPAALLPAVCYVADSNSVPEVLRYDINIEPSGVTRVAMPQWRYEVRLQINTASSGAGVATDVTDFPLLVRLDSRHLDFDEASPDGSDVRFTKGDRTLLAVQVDYWSREAAKAALWVLVDTIYGSDSTQNLFMYYGFSGATGLQEGAPVFDSTNGFAGVWHLDSSCGDATGNGNDGTNHGARILGQGAIGTAMTFGGSDSIKIGGLLGEPENVTLSAWVRTDTAPSVGQEIVTLGDAVLLRADEKSGYGTGGYAHQGNNDTLFNEVTSGLTIAKTGWRYLVFTFDNDNHVQMLYIDGIPVTTAFSEYAIDYSGVGSDTFIGMHGNGKQSGYAMRGDIDEVRVSTVVRSAAWIRLCYMNQGNVDRLVRFR